MWSVKQNGRFSRKSVSPKGPIAGDLTPKYDRIGSAGLQNYSSVFGLAPGTGRFPIRLLTIVQKVVISVQSGYCSCFNKKPLFPLQLNYRPLQSRRSRLLIR